MTRTCVFLALLFLVAAVPAFATFNNASSYLYVPTYDGHDQQVHPSIVYRPEGWKGHKYWMVMCPYYCGEPQRENPSIVVSQDGSAWDTIPGIHNPLVRPQAGNTNNDPDLLMVGDSLVLYYNETAGGYTDIKRIASADSLVWVGRTNPPTVLRMANYRVSPCIVYDAGTYHMWYAYWDSWCSTTPPTVWHRTSADGFHWPDSTVQQVTIDNLQGRFWHFDVIKDNGKFEMLFDTFPSGDCVGLRLYYAESMNGLSWKALGEPILIPSVTGWDNRDIYRSTFVTGDGLLRIWYSASYTTFCDSYGPPWHIGYTQGTLPDLTAPAAVTDLAVIFGKTTGAVIWTAPGDDENAGTATAYDLRISGSPISEWNFANATQVTTGTPKAAGGSECASLSGLTRCHTYYVALKTRDEAGNWSSLSNVPHGTTDCWISREVECVGESEWSMRPVAGEGEPLVMELGAPRPNPARDRMRVDYTVPKGSGGAPLELQVFDIAGREVATLARGRMSPGRYVAVWKLGGSDPEVRGGIYFVRFRLGAEQRMRVVTVVR